MSELEHKITVHRLFAEDVFDLFYKLIIQDCGDGAGAIICANPKEAMDLFVQYIKLNHNSNFSKFLDLDVDLPDGKENQYSYYNLHDNNENFIFTNDPGFILPWDTVMVIENDCEAGSVPNQESEIWLKGIGTKN